MYKELKTEILGEESSEEESGAEGDDDDDSEDEEVNDGISSSFPFLLTAAADSIAAEADGTVDVHDQTGTNMINLRRTIYLTIMSALDFEEAVHKLLRIDLAGGQEVRRRLPAG